METYNRLYDGITKTAWGYFFLYFDINLGTVSILPDFVGFLLFLSAINLLKDEERDLSLLRPFGILLALWNGAEWIASWVSMNLDNVSHFFNLIVCLVNLYFHFQLLTNMASIATKYQPEDANIDAKLLKYRTIQTIMLTVMLIFTYVSTLLGELWTYISLAIAIIYIVIGICMMKALFDLRRCLPTDVPTIEE